MTVTEFLNKEVVDFASYSTVRAIGSLVDGFKNSGRKVAFTTMNRSEKDTKVSILAGIIAIETEYLHGDISGSVTAQAKNYVGSNNIPLLTREGNFGTRFEPEASANRYIFTAKEKISSKIFNKDDENILIGQNFEGTDIEPLFYVPALPMILVNGSEGIATGFAQKILPRNPDVLKDYLECFIANNPMPELTPWYRGFRGTIEKGENDNQWSIKGTYEKLSATKLVITELPIGYNLGSYTKVLDDLEDKKVIRSYKDQSEEDLFKFEISMDSKSIAMDDEWIMNKLKLIKTVTENFTVMNEVNRIEVYNSPEEVIAHYIRVKLDYMQKRKDNLIEETKQGILESASKYIFIKEVTEENIIVNKQKKTAIIEQIEKYEKIIKVDDSYEYLLRMPIYSLTEEKMAELLEKIKSNKEVLTGIINSEITRTWLDEIEKI
jgi:DNA topoisomerase-2